MSENLLTERTDQAAEFLSLLANGKRLQIMGHLLTEELPVNIIANRVSLSQSALSQHLAKLRAVGLVETRRDRQMIYYSCHSQSVRTVMQTLQGIFGAEPVAA